MNQLCNETSGKGEISGVTACTLKPKVCGILEYISGPHQTIPAPYTTHVLSRDRLRFSFACKDDYGEALFVYVRRLSTENYYYRTLCLCCHSCRLLQSSALSSAAINFFLSSSIPFIILVTSCSTPAVIRITSCSIPVLIRVTSCSTGFPVCFPSS